MTFQPVYCVDGETTPSFLARLMLRSATRSGHGIIEAGDLRVVATSTPGSTVTIKDGAAVIHGAEALWQGSYYGYNLGDQSVSIDPATTARSDLVYARVEDPTFSGSSWDHDPATDPIWYPVVAKGVSSGTTTVPAGVSGEPLARIDIPSSTGTITSDMITDLRSMMDPRREQYLYTRQGSWDETDSVGNTSDWEQWPNGASWDLVVPPWATQFAVQMNWNGVQFVSHVEARGNLSGLLSVGSTTVRTTSTVYATSGGAGSSNYQERMALGGADYKAIPSAIRGLAGTFELQGENDGTNVGLIQSDGGSSFSVIIEFREVATHDVVDRSPA